MSEIVESKAMDLLDVLGDLIAKRNEANYELKKFLSTNNLRMVEDNDYDDNDNNGCLFMEAGPPDVIIHVDDCEPIRVSGASSVNINISIDNSVHTTNIRESNTHVDAKIGIGDAAIRFLGTLLG